MPEQADVEFPSEMELGGVTLHFEECVVPGSHIRFYKTLEKGTNNNWLLETYASSYINQANFNSYLEAISQLENPDICKTTKYGAIDSGLNYVLSQYPYGHTLKELLHSHGELKAELAVHIFIQMLDVLIYLNSKGMSHGNLMPINCYVVEDPKVPNKLMVGGISLPKNCFSNYEGVQYFEVLSPLYLAPERIDGADPSTDSDMYTVGALMYEALTGLPPYTGNSMEELHQKHKGEQLLPLRGVAPELDIPELVEQVVLKALNKNPAGRFSSLEDMKKELLYAAKESRIYLPNVAHTNYSPQVFTEQSDAPPEIHQDEKDLAAIQKEADDKKFKEEEEAVEKEIETKAQGLKASFMLLSVVVAVLIVGGAFVLLNSGSNEDKAPMYVKIEWEDSMSQGDSLLSEKKYAEAILKYNQALKTATEIDDDSEKKTKTLMQLVKAYEGHGDQDKVKALKKELIGIEKEHIKEIENE